MTSQHSFSKNIYILFTVLASTLGYLYFANGLERSDHTSLLILYGLLFLMYLLIVSNKKIGFSTLLYIAILFRILFLFATPNLSQDFYRFIWDGRMILEGFNPYLFTPNSFIEQSQFPVQQAEILYKGMGSLSAGNFTNYPPINQLCFVIAGLFSGSSILGSILVLRLITIAADIGIIVIGRKLLKTCQIDEKNIFLFVLNPLTIIELSGNLHFEGVMIFFILWSLYLLSKGKWTLSAIVLTLSVSTKLIPLMFLPLFWGWFTQCQWNNGLRSCDSNTHTFIKWITTFSWRGFLNLIFFWGIVLASTLLLFVPFYSEEFLRNYSETVGLWFQKFEFNASLYYIAREIGYGFRGYNEISIIGRWTAYIVILSILLIAFVRNNRSTRQLILNMVIILAVYFFTATTVHPWYILTLLSLSVFTNLKFPLVWSAVIVLSYLAYKQHSVHENFWPILIEYSIVFMTIVWDFWNNLQRNNQDLKTS